MISEVNQSNISYILSNAAQKAYDKIRALILKIFSIIKTQKSEKNLKEEFYNSYIDFARKLDEEGYRQESTSYMAICAMYEDLMDRPDELMAHECFFMDLFKAFDEVLFIRINKPEDYNEKYEEFIGYWIAMQQYYYTEVAITSQDYNKETCKRIMSELMGDLNE